MEELFWQRQEVLLAGCFETGCTGLAWQDLGKGPHSGEEEESEFCPSGGRSSRDHSVTTVQPQPPFPILLCCCGEEVEKIRSEVKPGKKDSHYATLI